MNYFISSLNFINKFIKKEHSYLIVLIEIAVLYTIYVFYKSTIIKFRNYSAYRKIT